MKKRHQKTKKRHKKRGGTNLAYPYNGTYLSKPLAYTGRGGYSSRMYPAVGPRIGGFNFLNPISPQSGGGYPNGLVGAAYNNPTNLPGVNGISGNANYYKNNTDPTLQTRLLQNNFANKPFFKGGKRKSQKGGAFSNSFGQELINLGRNVPFAFNSAYNGLFGYSPPVNPSPIYGQFANTKGQ
jgi:hypothetical protein